MFYSVGGGVSSVALELCRNPRERERNLYSAHAQEVK